MDKKTCAAQSNKVLVDLVPLLKSISIQLKLAQIREYSDIGKVTKEIYHQFRDLYGQAQAIDLDRIIDAQDEVLYRNMQSSQMGYEPVYNAFVEFCNVIRNTATEIMNSGVLPADKPEEPFIFDPMARRRTVRPVVRRGARRPVVKSVAKPEVKPEVKPEPKPVVQPEATHDEDLNELLSTTVNQKPEPAKEETPAEKEKRLRACLDEVLSMYNTLAKRANTTIGDLKTESPASMDDVKKATRNICKKIEDNGIEMNEKNILNMESSIDTYNKDPNEKNGRRVITSYKELYNEIYADLDCLFDGSLIRENGSALRLLFEMIPGIIEEMKSHIAIYFARLDYGKPKTYREAEDTVKDIYEKGVRIFGIKKNEAVLKTLSDRVEAYYNGECSFRELIGAFYLARDAFDKACNSTDEVPEAKKKKPKNVSLLQRNLETIFGNILKNHFSAAGQEDDEAKNFNMVHAKVDSSTAATCPKWYNFMESVFTKLGANKKYTTNKILIAILLASCCAADDMKVADAVCRAVRKITKDAKFKDEEYMKNAEEKIRKDIKSKIGSFKDPKGLDTVVQVDLKKWLGLDNALVTLIFGHVDQARSKK